MAILRFQPNIPLEVTLRSLKAQTVESKFGGSQHLFTAEEGIFYVSDAVGSILSDQFHRLGVTAGQTIEITKGVTGSGPGARTQWLVTVSSDATEPVRATQPEPASELESKLADSIALIQARKQPQPARAAAQPAAAAPAWAQTLLMQTNALVDVYAAALAHASSSHGNSIKPEDVRSLLTTTFINLSQKGAARVA
jgi:hypothetical protein